MNKPDPELPFKFANTVLEELAFIRSEVIAQRKLIIELLSLVSKEPRRQIRSRTHNRRIVGYAIARDLKRRAGLRKDEED